MKKWIWVLIVAVGVWMIATDKKEQRIRIIANSDSEFDQDIKMQVFYALEDTLKKTQDLNIILDKCEYIMSKYSVNYGVRVELKKHRFKARSFNGKIIPGGVYDTIVVSLGKAEGKNYWTVLYPDYFDIGFDEITDEEIEYKSWFAEKILGE